jgi:hypothetical protein
MGGIVQLEAIAAHGARARPGRWRKSAPCMLCDLAMGGIVVIKTGATGSAVKLRDHAANSEPRRDLPPGAGKEVLYYDADSPGSPTGGVRVDGGPRDARSRSTPGTWCEGTSEE